MHFARLLDEDRDRIEGIPVTSSARTLLDWAGSVSAYRLERAEELRLFDLVALDALLSRTRGHPGAGRLRRALDLYRAETAFTRSGFELRFLRLVRAAGLSVPAMNFNVAQFELDAYWEAERFAVELDVYETHGTRAAFERDRLRQEELKLAGIEMIRVTGPRLRREPTAVMERLRSLLSQRRRALSPPATDPAA